MCRAMYVSIIKKEFYTLSSFFYMDCEIHAPFFSLVALPTYAGIVLHPSQGTSVDHMDKLSTNEVPYGTSCF